ncbi:nuclear transport factor 2 family protein [Pseudotenacibaculum haliotis]|uniref:Nuclear transport factor 2 family protein n=1 Tax=Pseudotenacibaculum haliotis TaxID=1862138 RepID=A0ABW5LQF6_9FLAO
MKNLLIIVFLCCSYVSFSQASSDEQVKKTLQNYIDGSSYNKLKLLRSAFSKNATLYLTTRDGFKRLTPEDYVGFFKNSKEGEFNGRHGKILSVEVTKDIATARVEISIPKRKWIFIDLFLLKKTGEGWKIISKTATRIDNE